MLGDAVVRTIAEDEVPTQGNSVCFEFRTPTKPGFIAMAGLPAIKKGWFS